MKPPAARLQSGSMRCVVQTPSFRPRPRSIPMDASKRMCFGVCEANATTNRFFWRNEQRALMKSSNRNLRFGWWSLLVFLSLGGGLEILHGFKIGWYVDVGNEMRRLMFTLAH